MLKSTQNTNQYRLYIGPGRIGIYNQEPCESRVSFRLLLLLLLSHRGVTVCTQMLYNPYAVRDSKLTPYQGKVDKSAKVWQIKTIEKAFAFLDTTGQQSRWLVNTLMEIL